MTKNKIPDVLLQPPKIKTDTFQKASTGSPPQARPKAEGTVLRIHPGLSQTKTTAWRRTPGSQTFTKAETNKSITSAPSTIPQSETDALRKSHGTYVSPPRTKADSFKNISGIASDQLKPDQPRFSNTIANTPTIVHPLGNGRPSSGEPKFSNNLDQLYRNRNTERNV